MAERERGATVSKARQKDKFLNPLDEQIEDYRHCDTSPKFLLQGSRQEPLQPSLWQHIPYLPQPHLLFPPPVPFFRSLHGLYQLHAELRPLIHLLPSPNAPAARSPALDGPALHWLHEDTFLRGYGPYSLKPPKIYCANMN